MKLKLIVSSLFALGVMSVHPLAFGAAKDLTSATTPADAGLSEGRRQSGQPELFVADADQQVEPEEAGRGVEDAHLCRRPRPAGPGAGRQQHGPANLGARGRRRDLHRHARRRRRRHRRQDRRGEVEVDAVHGERTASTRRARAVASRSVTARSTRFPAATASWRSTRTRAPSCGRFSPPVPAARPLGNIAKVGTVYWDGMVYVGTNDGNPRRRASRCVRATAPSCGRSTAPPSPGHHAVSTTSRRDRHVDRDMVNSCAVTAGVTPWIHPSVDPELGMVYWSFGNVRSCGSSQDGQQRAGRQPVRQLDRRGGRQDRRLQVALPVDPARHHRHGQRGADGARRRPGRRRRPRRRSTTAASRR